MVGTTDDPIDSLEWHKKIKEDPTIKVVVAPSFRPDKVLNIRKEGFADYIHKLEEVVGRKFACAKLRCQCAGRTPGVLRRDGLPRF